MVTTGAKIVTFPVWKHFTKVNGEGHQKQMELFYQCQKRSYDSFRDSLLHARPTLIEYLPLKSEGGAVWVDIGGGTARNLEYLNPKTIRRHFKRIYIVDISPSLLSIASERLRKFGLEDLVTLVLHDVTSDSVFEELGLPLASVDVVTMSYSLSMIPDKDRAVENALKLLKPKEFESFVSTGCPKSQIVMVCVLQSWQPESRSILSMLQSTCAAHPAPPPTGPAPPLPAVCVCCFSMRKMSAAELARPSVFGALQVG